MIRFREDAFSTWLSPSSISARGGNSMPLSTKSQEALIAIPRVRIPLGSIRRLSRPTSFFRSAHRITEDQHGSPPLQGTRCG